MLNKFDTIEINIHKRVPGYWYIFLDLSLMGRGPWKNLVQHTYIFNDNLTFSTTTKNKKIAGLLFVKIDEYDMCNIWTLKW